MSTSVPTKKLMGISVTWCGGLSKIWGIRVPGRRTSRCKGPVAATSLMATGTERRPVGECDRGSIPVSRLGALFGWAGQLRSLLSLPWASSSSLALLDSESSGPILQVLLRKQPMWSVTLANDLASGFSRNDLHITGFRTLTRSCD